MANVVTNTNESRKKPTRDLEKEKKKHKILD